MSYLTDPFQSDQPRNHSEIMLILSEAKDRTMQHYYLNAAIAHEDNLHFYEYKDKLIAYIRNKESQVYAINK